MPLELMEKVTSDRLYAPGYLLANRDVADAQVDPSEHFVGFGRAEGRSQVNPDVMRPDSEYRRRKFERFGQMIVDEHARDIQQFPHRTGSEHFDISSYLFESSNSGFGPFVEEIEANPSKNYLDLGCGLRPRVYDNCLYLEVYPSVTADLIVEPTCRYPLASASFDGIACLAVLEHTREPWVVVSEMHRMLKPGGKVFIDWPFLQPVHGFPSHYYNATREGLMSLFQGGFDIDVCATYPNQTPDHTVHWILGKLIDEIPEPSLRDMITQMTVGELVGLVPGCDTWQRVLKALPDATISEFACGNSLIGRKRSPA